MIHFNTDLEGISTLLSWTAGQPTESDIEMERLRLEAFYDCKLLIDTVDHPTLSGKKYTRICWECQ